MDKNLRLQIAAFTLTRVVFNTPYRMVYPFLPVFSRGLGIDLAHLALAITARSAIGTLGPLVASLSDSRSRKAGMLFGTFLFFGGASLVAIWPVFPAFVAAMLLTTLGKYAFDPAMQAYLGDRIVYRQRGRVLAVTELGWSFSFILGVPLAGLLIGRLGWVAPFPVLAVLSLALFLYLYWILPSGTHPAGEQLGLWRNLRSVFTYPPALAGLSVGLLISLANEVVNLIFGVWMEDSFGLQIAALGAASAVIGLSELGGEGGAAWFVDRLGKIRAVGFGLALNILAAIALPFLGRSLTGALVALFLFYITFEFTLVSSIPLMTEIMPAARATLMASNIAAISAGRALGALLAYPMYQWGILVNVLAAAIFNILALVALVYLRKQGVEDDHRSPDPSSIDH